MVYLNRIYTKTGDEGLTSLGDGARVPKTDRRIAAYGAVDELNSVIGVGLAAGIPEPIAGRLRGVQNDLFDVGADLCVPEAPVPSSTAPLSTAPVSTAPVSRAPLRVAASQVAALETWIDEVTATLDPLTSFVLPGGSVASAHLHHGRTVCRRAEIDVLRLAEHQPVNPQVAIYLNRLSDLLFVLARQCNAGGKGDILWVPGQSRGGGTKA